MKRWRVLNVGSTEILLHPAVLAFAVYAFLLGYGRLWLLSVMSVILHEGPCRGGNIIQMFSVRGGINTDGRGYAAGR